MEYYNNILCIPASDYYHKYSSKPGVGVIVEKHYVSYDTYVYQSKEGKINIVRRGGGSENNYALIELESIPGKYLNQVISDNPNPERQALVKPLIELVKIDYAAVEFYTGFVFPDGSRIDTKRIDNIKLWGNNAAIMNAVSTSYDNHVSVRSRLGKNPLYSKFFGDMATAISAPEFKRKWEHNLPNNAIRLQEKFKAYKEISYLAFIKKNKGNSNAVVITHRIELLLAMISTLPTRPYNSTVVEYYEKFMHGRLELVDSSTGVLLDPADFLDKDGNIATFTEAAAWYHLNKPGMQVKIDKIRMGAKDFNDLHRPHRHRHAPYFSFSKVSMDDRDLVWKDSDSKKRVKAYYAYDVASGCRIGSAYSMNKDADLFLDCLRDMFVFIDRHGFGIPLEVEVENHLVKEYEWELQQMFPIVHFCAPANSQEKRAEHFNRAVKYQVEKNNHPGIGRWWLSSKYNRIPLDRAGDGYLERMKPAERLIAEDILDTIEYNNAMHKDQKRYPGMTRMQVLLENINPNLPILNKSHIYRYIGFMAETSIDRSQYVSVQYAKYMLPSPNVMDRLDSNNRDVEAYFMPNSSGAIMEVYIYQNGRYICTCERIETYNEAQAERTDLDREYKRKQDNYVVAFDRYVKHGSADLGKLKMNKPGKHNDVQPVIVDDKKEQPKPFPSAFRKNYSQQALDDFFN